MDALRTDDLTSSLGPFLLASLAIHVLLVFLLPIASIEVPERPAAPPATSEIEPGMEDLADRGLLAPLGSLRMQVLELAVPLPAPAAPLPAPAAPPSARAAPPVVRTANAPAPREVVVVPSAAGAAPVPAPPMAATQIDLEAGGATAGALSGGQAEIAGPGSARETGAEAGVEAGIVEPPVIVAMVWPEYPKAAKRELKIPIVLAVHVTAEGGVDQVEVETPSGCPSCEAAAMASAWQLRFQPATRDGAPIAMWTRFPVVFGRR